jgi:hypothetical protein
MPSSSSVFVATPTMGRFPVETVISYLDTQDECRKQGIDIDIGFVSCSLVHHARTLLTDVFMTRKNASHIFWIDSDIQWKPEDFLRILAHAQKHPVVCGVYPRRRDPPAYFIKFPPGTEKDPPRPDGLVEIEATGMGFTCIRREVMQHLYVTAPKLIYGGGEEMPRVFRCDDDGENERGEDYAFFADVREAGYKVYADATVTVGHVGSKVYRCRSSA